MTCPDCAQVNEDFRLMQQHAATSEREARVAREQTRVAREQTITAERRVRYVASELRRLADRWRGRLPVGADQLDWLAAEDEVAA